MANRIFGIIAWIGTACVLAAVGIRFGMPAQDQYARYLAWAGLGCMVVYMAGQWREIGRLFSRRQAQQGTLAGMSLLIVLGILIAVNYIGARQSKRWDLTASKQFTLSEQTRNILQKLDAPLHIMVFARDQEAQPLRDSLREYEHASSQVTTEYIDPDTRPNIAQQNQVQQYNTMIFNHKGRSERITTNTEQDITNAIIKVVSGRQPKVYFTQGHGEKDPTSTDRGGYNGITEAMKQDNYVVERVSIAQQNSVPQDASVVVVAGPQTDFFPNEIEALKKYLSGSGKLLLALDPPEGTKAAPLPNLIALAKEWGVDVGNDVVMDQSGMGQLFGAGATPAMPVVINYPAHPISDRFEFMTLYPLARSITPVSGGVGGRTAQPIAETSNASWAETDLTTLFEKSTARFDEGSADRRGPIVLGAATSLNTEEAPKPDTPPDAPRPETRVVVFGDSDFAANAYLGAQGNRDLFLNAVGWLSQQENLIAIRPREAADRRLTLTAGQQSTLWYVTLVGIPACIFAAGVLTWWRRR
jgi:ABC-type uncharacterized transport system involved in gliding motility auxiliary subunit